MAVEIDVEYQGDLHCRAVHGPSQSILTTDAPVDNGGKGELFSPTDLVAAGLGSCILTVMGLVARRRDIDLTGATVDVTKEMAQAPVRRIGRLTVTVTLPRTLSLSVEDRSLLERTADVCPVRQSLHPDVVVDIRFA
jgi:putative redox protein